jgi:heterodisulfide reductase subunit B
MKKLNASLKNAECEDDMSKIGYYPGCSLKGTAREFDASVRCCSKHAGIQLTEIPDWNCCGASSAHCVNHDLSVALPARTMAIAEEEGLEEVVAPCSMCWSSLAKVNHAYGDSSEKKRFNEIVGRKYNGSVTPLNLLHYFRKPEFSKKEAYKSPLIGLKVACYYGCLLVRPLEITHHERFESPEDMEKLLQLMGAQSVQWNHKTECCGGGLSLSRSDAIEVLVDKLISDAVDCGAQALVTACPMCMANLDMRQSQYTKKGNPPVPVFYLSELASLAMGAELKELELSRHVVNPTPLIQKVRKSQTGEG